jgi:hypothetical protein
MPPSMCRMDSVKGGKLLREIIAKRKQELGDESHQVVVASEVSSLHPEDRSAVVDLVRRWTAVPPSDVTDSERSAD